MKGTIVTPKSPESLYERKSQKIRMFIHNQRSDAERRRKVSLNPSELGNQPRSPRELNVAMVAEQDAKLALLSSLEAMLNELEAY